MLRLKFEKKFIVLWILDIFPYSPFMKFYDKHELIWIVWYKFFVYGGQLGIKMKKTYGYKVTALFMSLSPSKI